MDIEFVLTDNGIDEFVRRCVNLSENGFFSYFKLGEGGFELSDTYNESVNGDGGTDYSIELTHTPVEKSNFQITGSSQTLTDDGNGNLTGDGSGTIDYKSGDVEVRFNNSVTGFVTSTYKYRGRLSSEKEKVIGESPDGGSSGTYYGIIPELPIAENSITVDDGQDTPQTLTDDGIGNLTGDGSGAIDYKTGEISLSFSSSVPEGNSITVKYKYDGAAKDVPDPCSYTELESESDSDLYTFQKSFQDGDVSFVENGKVLCKVFLDLWEGIDDGSGGSPFFFEGGLFSEDDIMVAYFTFSKARKDGSTKIDINAYSVI